MKFRLATKKDLDQILIITNEAKAFLKASGSTQWNEPDGYPNVDTFTEDIQKNRLFVLEDNSTIVGYEALIVGKDLSYVNIDGKWLLDTDNYLTIHRIAINSKYRGMHISKQLVLDAIDHAKSLNLDSVRGDTHRINIPMQKLFKSVGFTECGIITLVNNKYDNKRLGFELKLKSL